MVKMKAKPSILITGDFCPVNRTSEMISGGSFKDIFNDFLPLITNADLAITNLECPLTKSESGINKIGPSMKGPVNSAKALAAAGFKLVTLANNHIMDYGYAGMRSTVDACTENGISNVGVGSDYRTAREVLYTKAGSFTIGVLNFAENEFSTTHGDYPGANPLDPIENYQDILMAKGKADYVIVIIHCGHERYNLPSPRIKSTLRFFADAGASAVFAHHAHCYSGYELYKGVPIFYGLGNFVFDKPARRNSYWNYGYAVEVILERTLSFNLVPYEQSNTNAGVKLMQDDGNKTFFDDIERINNIISDDDLLKKEFDKYCDRVRKMYLSYLEPHSIKALHFLRNKGFLPSVLSKGKRTLYLNLMRCESHRDVLINLLESRDFRSQ
jgi:poly-gamma-glutamate synthesis protein (capsule biosynthesis protein)